MTVSTATRVPFDNTYVRLPERFYARIGPTAVRAPKLIKVNRALARHLGIDPDWLESDDGVAVLAGNRIPEAAEPLAAAYAGHQFGHFVPQLGDGRAVLLGEVVDKDGKRRDIQLKGAGPTPFSRNGDGRAALGPVLREYAVSEAMAAMGIPTTRALAAVTTGEVVRREEPLPGAVLARVASSHIRVGTFQFFAARGDAEGVRLLADHAIARHYPEAAGAANPYRALLDAVVAAQAELIARWLLVGFIHGVMNTDNMSVAGETIDYGPCAFMDAYDPATVYSSIDHQGRYAFANQPSIALWNLARLAETLLPLIDDDKDKAIAAATEAIHAFSPRFDAALHAGLNRKLGLTAEREGDGKLAEDLLSVMAANKADFTNTFRRLGEVAAALDGDALAAAVADARVRALFADPTAPGGAWDAWATRWRARLAQEPGDGAAKRAAMHAANPAYIPRNHRVEAVIEAAVERGDFAPFEELVTVLAKPFEEPAAYAKYAEPPEPHERVLQTFCGT